MRGTRAVSDRWKGLDPVERWSAELTRKGLGRGVHRSVRALERGSRAWLADGNEHPGPFVPTRTADEILGKAAAHHRPISDPDHQVPRLPPSSGHGVSVPEASLGRPVAIRFPPRPLSSYGVWRSCAGSRCSGSREDPLHFTNP
ncbi:hypothetical protein GCM10017667_69990 [Streptomyces filamentosus]|uniref:Uncharacterized protein n=1 Tax=Streptomyces filamentosus TaxID=67294 RepID=A0A919BYG3_STRFL|nr:hypothetical protein GCM10017667_69990 [Streptomyces filamentosus]